MNADGPASRGCMSQNRAATAGLDISPYGRHTFAPYTENRVVGG